MVEIDELVTFLRERIDEDDRAARISPRDDAGDPEMVAQWSGKSASNLYVQFYAHFNPARVLREIEAKRRILERHQPRLIEGRDGDGVEREAWFCSYDDEPWPCADARDAVAPYSDHGQFREEWRA